jgi:mevalonate kinase
MDRRRNLVLTPMKALKIYLLLLFMAGSSLTFAQRNGQPVDPERLQAARIAFITTRINLKTEQAEKFWPLFNTFTESREASMRTMGDLSRGAENMSEEEAKSRIQQKLQIQQKLVQDEKIFVADAAKVLTYKQLLLLQNIARDFNRHLYDRGRPKGN